MILLYIAVFTMAILIALAKQNTIINNKYNNTAILVILFILISISVYHVNIDSVVDLRRYSFHFSSYQGISLFDIEFRHEPLFSLLQWIVVNSIGSFKLFLVVVWFIIFMNFYKAVKNLFNKVDILFVFVTYFTFFIFFDYVLNAMRQGLAMSFLVLSLSILVTNSSKFTFYISIILAPLFHITSLPFSIVLLLFKWFRPKLRTVFFFWLLSIILFVTNLNSRIFSTFSFEALEIYSSDRIIERYSAVNRIDFLVFGIFFAFVGFIVWKYVFNRENNEYKNILSLYLLFNMIFLFFGFIAYSDRLASYSWILIPIILWKSIYKTKNYRYKAIALLLGFLAVAILTGSMNIIIEPFV